MNSVTLIASFVSAIQAENFVSMQISLPATTSSGQQTTLELTVDVYGKAGQTILDAEYQVGQALLIQGKLYTEVLPDSNQKIYYINSSSVLPVPTTYPLFQVALLGRLGNDLELQFFESGACKASSSLGVSRSKQETDWFNFTCWGKQGETLSNYSRKGDQISLVCNGEFNFSESRNQFYLNLTVQEFGFGQKSRNNGNGNGGSVSSGSHSMGSPRPVQPVTNQSDIPF